MSSKPLNKLLLDQRVLSFIQEHRLATKGKILLVAVSGGQDSVCLLHVLHQLQSEVDLRREQYKKTAERAADLGLESGIADSGLASIGVVVTPNRPAFPNKALIIGGALGLGAALGLALAVLVELLNRRVRGIEDLNFGRNLNCLGTIGAARPKRQARNGRAPPRQMTNVEVGA